MENSLSAPTLFPLPWRISRSRAFLLITLAVFLLAMGEKSISPWCQSAYGTGLCTDLSLPLNFFLDLAFITLVVLVFDGSSDRLLLSGLGASLVYHAGGVMGGWMMPLPKTFGLNFTGSLLPVFLGQTVLVAVLRFLVPAVVLRLLTRCNWKRINALIGLKFGLFLLSLSAGMIALMFALAALTVPGAANTVVVLTVENVAGGLLSVLAVWMATMGGRQIRERATRDS